MDYEPLLGQGPPKALSYVQTNAVQPLAEKLGSILPEVDLKQPSKVFNSTVKDLLDDGATSEEDDSVPSPNDLPVAADHPLFPPLPEYGPPTPMRKAENYAIRAISGFLSGFFVFYVVCGAISRDIPIACKRVYKRRWLGVDPDEDRPFYHQERTRAELRRRENQEWEKQAAREREEEENALEGSPLLQQYPDEKYPIDDSGNMLPRPEKTKNKEGGKEVLTYSVRYYANRVGLEVDEYKVETRDGFILTLQHVYDPANKLENGATGSRKYPVLLMHGLLQSSGAFCANDDDSMAFFLCKSGYDVWLGNNRCGSHPEHTTFTSDDPRMWAWNIRHMGIFDLPAFVNHILHHTGFPKLALVAHSQGAGQALIALSRTQCPQLADKISVFCALAPAVYCGKTLQEVYFRFLTYISQGMFRLIFGIHAFIPLMMWFHKIIPGRLYGELGYRVFSFLFKWSDTRWDRGLRNRFFMFEPVYASAESLRWWLGKDGFATQKCILEAQTVTAEGGAQGQVPETQELLSEQKQPQQNDETDIIDDSVSERSSSLAAGLDNSADRHKVEEAGPWFAPGFPPFAVWTCGADGLVDGKRFLRRLESGQEPHVPLIHNHLIDEYEHLDVLWAVDSIERVGWEVRDVIWKVVKEEIEEAKRKEEEQEVRMRGGGGDEAGSDSGYGECQGVTPRLGLGRKKASHCRRGRWWENVLVPIGVKVLSSQSEEEDALPPQVVVEKREEVFLGTRELC